MTSHPLRDGAEFFPAAEPEPQEDRRAVAMAKEWVRMMGYDPDEVIATVLGKAPRYLRHMGDMERLLAAADSVTGVTPRPRS